jgi:hypothetical protein
MQEGKLLVARHAWAICKAPPNRDTIVQRQQRIIHALPDAICTPFATDA